MAPTSCYEAGRDGFWLDRCLHHHGINNVIVDSSSIEVNRRAPACQGRWSGRRQPGPDCSLATAKARRMCGARSASQDPADEDQRHMHRELDQLQAANGRTTVTASVVCSPPSVSRSRGRTSCPTISTCSGSGTASQCPRASNGRLLHELPSCMELLSPARSKYWKLSKPSRSSTIRLATSRRSGS